MLICNAEVQGGRRDVRIGDGRVLEIGARLDTLGHEEVVDADGGALIPGLTDHHLHLHATAADLDSTPCGPPTVRSRSELAAALYSAAPDEHGWIRGVRYHESVAGELNAAKLDAIRADVPVRLQHRSGALWILNSRAAAAVGLAGAGHPGVERDLDGMATGRLWRADDWLRRRLPTSNPPSLARLGQLLARYGITSITDATPGLAADTVAAIAAAMASGDLPQRVQLLGASLLPHAQRLEPGPTAGPWKIVLADSGLPTFDELTEAIAAAHRVHRPVAVHTVTRESLILLLAALERVGTLSGDRLEHAALVPVEALPTLRRMGLAVVTQPGFIAERGDDYLRGTPPSEHADLYRCASFRRAHIPLALSSDAPYGPLDPWSVIRSATTRMTPSAAVVGSAECLTADQALDCYLTPADAPGHTPNRVRPGMPADLVLLRTPLGQALRTPSADTVAMTVIDGKRLES